MPAGVHIPTDPETLRKFKVWFTIYGVILALLGIASIVLPGVATLATSIFVGWILVVGGILGLISVFQAGTSAPGFWWNLLTALLYLIAGGVLLWNPISAMFTLTIVLAAYLIATGIAKVLTAFHYRRRIPQAWGWMLFSAVVDILLGVIIVTGLPGTAIWAIGLMVGINLLFSGIALLVSAIYIPRHETGTPQAA